MTYPNMPTLDTTAGRAHRPELPDLTRSPFSATMGQSFTWIADALEREAAALHAADRWGEAIAHRNHADAVRQLRARGAAVEPTHKSPEPPTGETAEGSSSNP